MNVSCFLEQVGRTPLVKLPLAGLSHVDLFAKLEFANPMGSVKDRAAAFLLQRLVHDATVDRDTWIVESSSGNFGVALAAYCRSFGLKFRCVVDPRISATNEMLIRHLGGVVFKVQERDSTGGYLLTRIAAVREFLASTPKTYWTNQYENPLVAEAYYETLGAELVRDLPRIDYAFLAVSSGGTIAGVSRRLREAFPKCKIIAVDSEGSVVFGGAPRARFVPGIGSSMVPPILAGAAIDHVSIIDEPSAISACHRLLSEHGIFAGGSSGFVIAAVERYFARAELTRERPTVVCVLPDRGDRYASTVYDAGWCAKLQRGELSEEEERKQR